MHAARDPSSSVAVGVSGIANRLVVGARAPGGSRVLGLTASCGYHRDAWRIRLVAYGARLERGLG